MHHLGTSLSSARRTTSSLCTKSTQCGSRRDRVAKCLERTYERSNVQLYVCARMLACMACVGAFGRVWSRVCVCGRVGVHTPLVHVGTKTCSVSRERQDVPLPTLGSRSVGLACMHSTHMWPLVHLWSTLPEGTPSDGVGPWDSLSISCSHWLSVRARSSLNASPFFMRWELNSGVRLRHMRHDMCEHGLFLRQCSNIKAHRCHYLEPSKLTLGV